MIYGPMGQPELAGEVNGGEVVALGLLEVLRKVSVWPKDLYSFDVAVTGGRKGQSNALR